MSKPRPRFLAVTTSSIHCKRLFNLHANSPSYKYNLQFELNFEFEFFEVRSRTSGRTRDVQATGMLYLYIVREIHFICFVLLLLLLLFLLRGEEEESEAEAIICGIFSSSSTDSSDTRDGTK